MTDLGILRVELTDALVYLDEAREGASNDDHIEAAEAALEVALSLLDETQVYVRPEEAP